MLELVCLCLSYIKQSGDDRLDFFFKICMMTENIGGFFYYLLVGGF